MLDILKGTIELEQNPPQPPRLEIIILKMS